MSVVLFMLEIALDFEQKAAQLSPIVLIAPGLVAVLLGLFVWLGGLGFRRILAVIVGAVSGGVCGFFIASRNVTPAMAFAIAAAVIAVVLEKMYTAIAGTGFFFWRFIPALCCAALGTMLIFAGMILLLLYKGALPVSCISRNQSFYASVFMAATAFGTIEQLLLCQRTKKQPIRKKQASKDKEIKE